MKANLVTSAASTPLRVACLSVAALILALLPSAGAEDKKISGDVIPADDGQLIVCPINHATFVIGWKDQAIYVDPVGGGTRFAALPSPDLIILTDTHGDHFDVPTLTALASEKTKLVAPKAALEKLPENLRNRTLKLENGESASLPGILIEAIPMYNVTPERLRFHQKGRGNGYLLTLGGKRIYISGDTEDIPEMRALRNIDVAFICMNLPYTMDVEQAASAVREFRPSIVYPYHYRGSDLGRFRELVGQDSGVEVRLRDWYR
jgi:L-ascorbate metabolism protein UlaG (beta-lactamase superfamily)